MAYAKVAKQCKLHCRPIETTNLIAKSSNQTNHEAEVEEGDSFGAEERIGGRKSDEKWGAGMTRDTQGLQGLACEGHTVWE